MYLKLRLQFYLSSTNELNFTLPGAGKPTKPVSKVQPMQPSGKPSGNDDRQDPASLPGPNLGAGTHCIGSFYKHIRLYNNYVYIYSYINNTLCFHL